MLGQPIAWYSFRVRVQAIRTFFLLVWRAIRVAVVGVGSDYGGEARVSTKAAALGEKVASSKGGPDKRFAFKLSICRGLLHVFLEKMPPCKLA